jgi:1,4-alpha-glucan branching enzyme
MKIRVRKILLFLASAIVLFVVFLPCEGCLLFRVIRDRLPPPHAVEGGILFQFEAPSARYVNLAGNFNDWCATATTGRFDPKIDPMEDPDGDGIWTIIKPLRPGRYQYKFVIDHGVRWERDPNNPGTDQEGGFTNSLVIVR